MDKATLVTYMIQFAKREVFDGKGRIFLPDFLEALSINPKPTVTEMLEAWITFYPKIPIRQATENVILIDSGRSVRVPE